MKIIDLINENELTVSDVNTTSDTHDYQKHDHPNDNDSNGSHDNGVDEELANQIANQITKGSNIDTTRKPTDINNASDWRKGDKFFARVTIVDSKQYENTDSKETDVKPNKGSYSDIKQLLKKAIDNKKIYETVFEVVSRHIDSNYDTIGLDLKMPDGKQLNKVPLDCIEFLTNQEISNLMNKMLGEKEQEKLNSIKQLKLLNNFETQDKMYQLISAGLRNLWLVGESGTGKSVITRMVANKLNVPYLCMSCSIGTSAAEFVGYKYPNREGTKFAAYFQKPSVILIDEMTALDPAVGQVLNAALANDELETTTGTVFRHPECIIVATSNTFGNGADRQYVANNQLDASTIDRFAGGMLYVDYSAKYESRFDSDVVNYVKEVRKIIKLNQLRRVASTRMIIAGEKLKQTGIADWRKQLVINWSDGERKYLEEALKGTEHDYNRTDPKSVKMQLLVDKFYGKAA
jgi:MoxR-like ATPase